MKTKYGEMPDAYWINYLNDLVDKIYKILPLKEERIHTLNVYIEALIRELTGNGDFANKIDYDGYIVAICSVLNQLLKEDDLKIYRTDIFKCISIVNDLKSSIQRGDKDGF